MHTPRDRQTDPLARLRFAIETMPGSRKYIFTPGTRKEVLQELYAAFWGPYQDLFLPPTIPGQSKSLMPSSVFDGLLSEAQRTIHPHPDDEPPNPGKPCGRIFNKGDSCYRCR